VPGRGLPDICLSLQKGRRNNNTKNDDKGFHSGEEKQ
jgi:hypothetical protein